MLLPTFLCAIGCSDWHQMITIEPRTRSQFSLFGTSIAICPTSQRMAVGCPSNRDGSKGEVYVLTNDYYSRDWPAQQALVPNATSLLIGNISYNVSVRGLGATVAISSDGKTIVSGAPHTSFSNATHEYTDVGAIAIFREGPPNAWSAYLSVPNELRSGGLYGQTFDSSSDTKFYGSAYGDQLFVAMDNDTEWTVPKHASAPPAVGNFTGLEFVDASTLLAGSAKGLSVFKKSMSGWLGEERTVDKPPDFVSFGEHVSMPENDQTTVAVLGKDAVGDAIAFMVRNDANNRWEYRYLARYPTGATGGVLEFCHNRLLASIGTLQDGTHVVFLFGQGPNGEFELQDTIEQPIADRSPEFHLDFASSIAWDNGHCSQLAIGAVSPGYEMSRVYVYYKFTAFSWRMRENEYAQVVIIGTVFGAGMIIIITVVMASYLVIRFRRRRREQQQHPN